MSRNAGSGEIGRFDEIFMTINFDNFAKFVKLGRLKSLAKFCQGCLHIIWVNILTCPEGSQTVGEFGDNDKFDDSDEISPRVLTKSLDWIYLNLLRRVPKSWRIWRKWRIWWKWRIWPKWRFWRNFAKGVDEIFRVNILTCLKGSQKVGEFGGNGRFGKNGDSDEILPRVLTKSFD